MNSQTNRQKARYYRANISSFTTNMIHKKNPWVAVWWSAAFPGMGHILNGTYMKGFVFFFWEFLINVNGKINQSLMYSFTGQFEMVKEVIDMKWALLYIPVYIATMWDSYRNAVEINKLFILASKEKTPIVPFHLSSVAMNYLDRRQPTLSMVWSMLMPGMGHLYLKRVPTGFIILLCWITCSYFSNLIPALQLILLGDFAEATAILDAQWMLFMPSLYVFAIYDSYSMTVEFNKLYKTQQSEYFKKEYQSLNFKVRSP